MSASHAGVQQSAADSDFEERLRRKLSENESETSRKTYRKSGDEAVARAPDAVKGISDQKTSARNLTLDDDPSVVTLDTMKSTHATNVCFASVLGVLADLQRFKEEHGHVSIPVSHPSHMRMMDAFSSVGMEQMLDTRWDHQCAGLKAFKREHGDLCIPETHPTLGVWVRTQYDHFKLHEQRLPGPLTGKRHKRLCNLGFDEFVEWEVANKRKKYERRRERWQEDQELRRSASFKGDIFPIEETPEGKSAGTVEGEDRKSASTVEGKHGAAGMESTLAPNAYTKRKVSGKDRFKQAALATQKINLEQRKAMAALATQKMTLEKRKAMIRKEFSVSFSSIAEPELIGLDEEKSEPKKEEERQRSVPRVVQQSAAESDFEARLRRKLEGESKTSCNTYTPPAHKDPPGNVAGGKGAGRTLSRTSSASLSDTDGGKEEGGSRPKHLSMSMSNLNTSDPEDSLATAIQNSLEDAVPSFNDLEDALATAIQNSLGDSAREAAKADSALGERWRRKPQDKSNAKEASRRGRRTTSATDESSCEEQSRRKLLGKINAKEASKKGRRATTAMDESEFEERLRRKLKEEDCNILPEKDRKAALKDFHQEYDKKQPLEEEKSKAKEAAKKPQKNRRATTQREITSTARNALKSLKRGPSARNLF